jgi:hypothetical protein
MSSEPDSSLLPVPLSPVAKRILDPNGPLALRQMAAKGIAPGMKPGEAITVLVLLGAAHDVGETAKATLDDLPLPLLSGALAGPLGDDVFQVIAPKYAGNAAIAGKILVHASVSVAAILEMARHATEDVAELIATNEERLLAFPAIIEALYKNRTTRMSTCDRIIELAARNGVELTGISCFKEVVASLEGEPIIEASEAPNFDDQAFTACETLATSIAPPPPNAIDPDDAAMAMLIEDTHQLDEATGAEIVKQKFEEVKKRFEDLKTSAKIRIALTTKSPSVRNMALRDASKLVRKAAVKADGFTEAEAEAVAARKNAHEDVLREIGMTPGLTRRHKVKVNLVMNPRTPMAIAQRFLTFMREYELKDVAGSRDVPGAISQQAKQLLARKKK